MSIEFLEGSHLRDGHHEVAAGETHTMLYPSLLMSLTRSAKVALEQVMAAKDDESLLFLPVAPFQNALHGGFQIVVTDTSWYTLEMVESPDMPFEKRFLLLRREGHHEQPPGVAQAHEEQLHPHPLASDNGDPFPPVRLRIAPGIELQRNVQLGPPLALTRARTFNDPLSERAPLLAHADQMAAELAKTLFRGGYQAEGLRLYLEEESGEAHTVGAPVKPPSAEGEKLSRLAGRLLGRLTPARPVAALSLTVYLLRSFHLGATQLALFTGAPDRRGERLHEALRRLRERFGEMIVVVASLIGPPPPCPVEVTTDPTGIPRALIWRGRIRQVVAVYDTWRERCRWWSPPVERDYFRLETGDGQVRVVFRDVRADRWLVERRYV